MVVQRINIGNKLQSPMKSLVLMLVNLGLSSTDRLSAEQCFSQMSSNIAQTSMLKSARIFLDSFHPLVQCDSSGRANSLLFHSHSIVCFPHYAHS